MTRFRRIGPPQPPRIYLLGYTRQKFSTSRNTIKCHSTNIVAYICRQGAVHLPGRATVARVSVKGRAVEEGEASVVIATGVVPVVGPELAALGVDAQLVAIRGTLQRLKLGVGRAQALARHVAPHFGILEHVCVCVCASSTCLTRSKR